MSVRPVAFRVAFACAALVTGSFGAACVYTSQGAGGAAAALWSPDGAIASNDNDGGSSSTNPNGGGAADDAASTTTGSIDSSTDGNGGNGGDGTSGKDASATADDSATSCPAPTGFVADCEAYYADKLSTDSTCSQCIAGSTCGSDSAAACDVPSCEQKCETTLSCSGSSCPPDRFCACMADCEETQGGTCCVGQTDQLYSCASGMCGPQCVAPGGADGGVK